MSSGSFSGKGQTLGSGDAASAPIAQRASDTAAGVLNLDPQVKVLLGLVAGYLFLVETHPQFQAGYQSASEEAVSWQHFRADSSAMATKPTDNTPAANLQYESYGTFNAVSEEVVEEEWNLKPDGTSRTASVCSTPREKVFTKRRAYTNLADLRQLMSQDPPLRAGPAENPSTLTVSHFQQSCREATVC